MAQNFYIESISISISISIPNNKEAKFSPRFFSTSFFSTPGSIPVRIVLQSGLNLKRLPKIALVLYLIFFFLFSHVSWRELCELRFSVEIPFLWKFPPRILFQFVVFFPSVRWFST
jgi:hypothetical protein